MNHYDNPDYNYNHSPYDVDTVAPAWAPQGDFVYKVKEGEGCNTTIWHALGMMFGPFILVAIFL